MLGIEMLHTSVCLMHERVLLCQLEEFEEALHITEGDDADDVPVGVAPTGAQNDDLGELDGEEVEEATYDHPYERA